MTKLPRATPEVHAACIVAAATLLASPKVGLVGEKGPLPERVATLSLQILDEYFKAISERKRSS